MKPTEFADLSDCIPEDSTRREILKADGSGTGWSIDLAGPGHEKAVAWSNEQARKGLRRAAQIEAQQLNGRKVKPEDRDVEDSRRDNVGWVVSRITGWSPVKIPFISPDPIEFSDDAAIKVFGHPKMGWAMAQVIEWLVDEKTFTKASASA